MAIFSLNHSYLGKSHKDYKPGVARAHANYITRESTCSKLIGERMPTERQAMKAWLSEHERTDRRNAHVIDKVMVALPIELTPEQREQLIRDYCEHVTKGQASWAAAIHDKGKDIHNPHAHIILRDRDEAGAKVMHTTAGAKVIALAAAKGIDLDAMSPSRFREEWERIANLALERAGVAARIDRRSLKEQGIDREAGIHVGPKSQVLEAKEYGFASRQRPAPRFVKTAAGRVIDYPAIDGGRSRRTHNEEIGRRNRARHHVPEAVSAAPNGRIAAAWRCNSAQRLTRSGSDSAGLHSRDRRQRPARRSGTARSRRWTNSGSGTVRIAGAMARNGTDRGRAQKPTARPDTRKAGRQTHTPYGQVLIPE